MASKALTRRRKAGVAATVAATSVAAGASWMALVAATTLGLGPVARHRAEVSANSSLIGQPGRYRLIVQSYAPGSVGDDHLPQKSARPLASTQRAITPEELANGIAVDVVGVGEALEAGAATIVAWVEHGEPDLDFDAARARPAQDAVYGVAQPATGGAAHLVLSRRV